MQKNYPVLYNQQNYPQLLGTSTTATIASDGCFDTSLAMKACYYGHTVNPIELNQQFTDKGIYINTDLLPDNALSQIYSDVKYLKTLDYEPIPTDLGTIQTLLDDPATTLTIRIYRESVNGYHFVEAVACDGHTLHIANPWSGNIEDFSQDYGDPVTAKLHVIVYTGPAPVAVETSQDQASSTLAQNFANTVTKSKNFDTVASFLGMSADDMVKTTSGQVIVDQIKALQEEVQNLQEQVSKAQQTNITQVVVPASTPSTVIPPVPPVTGAVFADGSQPVSSTPSQAVPKTVKVGISVPRPTKGTPSNNVFARIFRLLFL